jgi:DNA-directed RNA polymerase specialized sigma24 family protein
MKNEWVLKHRRLVYGLARKYWKAVPTRHKCWVDIEDFYMVALLHVLANADKYDRTRGAETNFIHNVASRKLQDQLTRLNQARRDETNTVTLGDIQPVVQCKYFGDSDAERRVLAFFRLASDAASQYVLQILVCGKVKGRVPQDLLWACQRSGVCAEDFIRCQAALVG